MTAYSSEIQATEKRRSDSLALRDAFYRSYDPTYLEKQCQVLLAKKTVPNSLKFLGEGRHFSAWQCASASSQDDLVIRLASSASEQDHPEFRALQKAIPLLAKSKPALIPPMEFLRVGRVLALVSPLGALGSPDLASHWRPLEDRVLELKNHLQSLGLKIDDVIQIAFWRGIPFVYDLSDLQFG